MQTCYPFFIRPLKTINDDDNFEALLFELPPRRRDPLVLRFPLLSLRRRRRVLGARFKISAKRQQKHRQKVVFDRSFFFEKLGRNGGVRESGEAGETARGTRRGVVVVVDDERFEKEQQQARIESGGDDCHALQRVRCCEGTTVVQRDGDDPRRLRRVDAVHLEYLADGFVYE